MWTSIGYADGYADHPRPCVTPSISPSPTPMEDPEITSRRGREYVLDRDELYRNRLLAEGHVIHLDTGGDWSVVMGHEVQTL